MTKIEGITSEINKALKAYAYEVSNEVDIAKDEVANQLKKDLIQDSPKQTGSYKKGWRIKKYKKANIVHNKTDYQLTHLLEYSHVLKRGGRKIGEVRPKVHIRPNEEKAIREFLKRVEKAVKR